MAKAYQYDISDYYAGESEDYGFPPNNSTPDPVPPRPWVKQWPQRKDNAWVMVEDHRERAEPYFALEYAQDATPYWMPEDNWQSQPRTMKEPGPLPEGYSLTRPEKTYDNLATDLRSQRDSRIAATQWLMERHTDELANAGATTLSVDQYAALLAYRQALRDMPQADGFPWDGGGALTPWPVRPE